jgi:hypothetical protein
MSLNTNTELFLTNTTSNSGTINLPVASSIPGRVLEFKDTAGTFNTNILTLVCNDGDKFEDGSSSKVMNTKFGLIQLVASGSKWYILNGTQVNTFQVSSLTTLGISTFTTNTSSINVSSIGFIDNRNSTNTLYTSTSYLFYNNFIISGTRIGYSNTFKSFGFYPLILPSLALWMDASDKTTIITSGTTLTGWNDKSGFGRNATLTGNPTLVTNSLNGLNGLQFSGLGQYWTSPSFQLSPTSQISAFVVAKGTKSIALNINLLQSVTSYRNMDLYLNYSGINEFANYIGQNAGAATTFTNTDNVPNIYELVYNSVTAFPYVNGLNYTTFSAPIGGNSLTASQQLRAANNAANVFIEYEVLFFNTNLTTPQQQQVEGYLAWKWGLQANLPANHPYKNAPP